MSALFDDIRAEVLPGNHLVTRLPGLVAVIRRDKNTDASLAQLLGLLRSASQANPAEPGRDLARQLTRWVVGANSVPDFGTVATVGQKLAVFLHGDINFEEVTTAGSNLADDAVRLAGSEAAFTVDRLLEWTGGTFALTVGPVEPGAVELVQGAADIIDIPDWAGLRAGAVPGAGVVLNPRAIESGAADSAAAPGESAVRAATGKPVAVDDLPMTQQLPVPQKQRARAAAETAPPPAAPGWTPPPAKSPISAGPTPASDPVEDPIPQPNWPPPPEVDQEPLPAPKFSELIQGSPVSEEPRAPLAVAGPPLPPGTRDKPQPVDPTKPAGVIVKGFRCSRGHLNDPRVSFCSVCGIRMDQLTGILVNERRPPLGLLVLDIGSTFVLDDNYLLGRNPEIDEAVIAGRVRPIRVDDDSGNLSRVHAEIRLEGWDVVLVDRGSANGTYVAGPGQQGWTRLAPLQPFILAPGTQVRTGRRMFTFESSQARL